MTLSVGDRLPEADLFVPGESGPEKKTVGELFAGRKIVLVGMPGAFTPTCHRNHLPGFLENRDAILEKGVDEILVLSTNDTHVLRAWAEASGAKDRVRFISDGNADFVQKAGLAIDRSVARHGHALEALRHDRRGRGRHVDLASRMSPGRRVGQLRGADSRQRSFSARAARFGASGTAPCPSAPARRRARSGRGRHGRAPSASPPCGARSAHRAPARGRRSSPACGRRSASRSASSRGSIA